MNESSAKIITESLTRKE